MEREQLPALADRESEESELEEDNDAHRENREEGRYIYNRASRWAGSDEEWGV